jgi:predicted phage terminase large subunit-like protein
LIEAPFPVEAESITVEPQPGPQDRFSKLSVDIAVYGGAAGAGKSYALLMEPLYHIFNPEFGAVIFRRTYPQITNEGGLWDSSEEIYGAVRDNHQSPKPKLSTLEWIFPSGARVRFAHMQHEKDRHQWDGAQIPFIGFDQLEHFTRRQFFYMLSRNRSMCGVKPYIRATCNPDPDHWLRTFMEWYIDDETGLPIPERSGVVRWFVVINDVVYWGDSKKELIDKYGEEVLPKSFTFISGYVEDNKILCDNNPDYVSNLEAMALVDRERLRKGNWNIRESAGMFYQRGWFEIVSAAAVSTDDVRYWDRAATETAPGKEHTASHTAGVRMIQAANGLFYITDSCRFQGSPMKVEDTIYNVATQDGKKVRVGIEQDPGQAGKAEAQMYVRKLAGFNVFVNAVRESKGVRARPLSAQVEAGNVKLVNGKWVEAFIQEMVNFDGSDGCVSDQVDAASGAFLMLTNVKRAGTWGRRR